MLTFCFKNLILDKSCNVLAALRGARADACISFWRYESTTKLHHTKIGKKEPFDDRLTPNNKEHDQSMRVVIGCPKNSRADKNTKDSVSKPEATIAAEDGPTKDIVPVNLCRGPSVLLVFMIDLSACDWSQMIHLYSEISGIGMGSPHIPARS